MVEKISKLIGDDINNKLIERGIPRMYIYKNCGICSEPTLLKILRGQISNVVPLSKIIAIYKAIGENEINIHSDYFSIKIKIRNAMHI